MRTIVRPTLWPALDATDPQHRFTQSASRPEGLLVSTQDFHEWLAERHRANDYRITRAPLDRLDGWTLQEGTGNLVHRSGRFYSIEGLEVVTDHRGSGCWAQPIIVQPEIGILGILVKEFDGVLHCLMQAKMEPGNIGTLQLSPTVQATRSNVSRVHAGGATPYVEYFTDPARGRILSDALQSEQGAWFLRKRNRNIIVETTEDVPVLDDFCWLTLGQVQELLRVDNLVNMDSRTVLAQIPLAVPAEERALREDSFRGALLRSLAPGHHTHRSAAELQSLLIGIRAGHDLRQHRVPLATVPGWSFDDGEIRHADGRFFRVVGVDVQASNREVRAWSQPLLAPCGRGLAAMLTKRIGGVLHLLVQIRTEAGTFDVAELAPTVVCNEGNYDSAHRPDHLDEVLGADPARIVFDVVLSEEGGRLLDAENRYVIVEADHLPVEPPPDHAWMTVRQVDDLIRDGGAVTVEARTLIACLHTLW